MRRKLFNYHIQDGYVYKRYRDNQAVSYTHLTLPTIYSV